MSTPRDSLHAALVAQPLQTATELAARSGATASEVERLLHADPRLRHDDSSPPRWRALGAGHPATLLHLPTPHRSGAQMLVPAAAFGRRPAPRLQESLPAPVDPPPPVRVPVAARVSATPVRRPARPAPVTEPTPVVPVVPVASVASVASVVDNDRQVDATPEALRATPPSGTLFRALAAPAAVRGPLPPGGDVRYVGPQLRRWQKDVLDAWLATDRRGIVEAVDARGRRGVGVLAAWDALTRGEKVLVLVPTTDLLERWFSTLEIQLPGLSIGRRDQATTHTFDECDVLVSLVSGAFAHDLLADRAGLLIADEVHRYGSPRAATTLREGFGARLGLTTALERQDAGVDEVLQPYFGAVLDGCDLRRGRADGVLAPFRLALVPVDLGADEQREHDALSAQITELAERLADHGCTPGTFLADVVRLQGGWRDNPRAAADASAYLRATSARRDLLATSAAVIDSVATLGPLLARSTRGLVVTHAKEDAGTAANLLRAEGVATAWFHPGLEPEARRATVRDLRRGTVTVLAAARSLDDGLDLPPVDAVVLLSASRTRRQLLERVSPVLRTVPGGRVPVVVVVHARGTTAADDGFVADLRAVATEVRTFDRESPAAIAAWFVGA